LSNLGFSFSAVPHNDRLDPPAFVAVSKHRSEKMLYASIAEGVMESSVGGSVGRVRGMEEDSAVEEIRSNTTMTA
jgi:hypothetical protein